jgi:hypothetical protein
MKVFSGTITNFHDKGVFAIQAPNLESFMTKNPDVIIKKIKDAKAALENALMKHASLGLRIDQDDQETQQDDQETQQEAQDERQTKSASEVKDLHSGYNELLQQNSEVLLKHGEWERAKFFAGKVTTIEVGSDGSFKFTVKSDSEMKFCIKRESATATEMKQIVEDARRPDEENDRRVNVKYYDSEKETEDVADTIYLLKYPKKKPPA